MLTHAQTKTAYALLARADAAFAAGDWPLGSVRLWEAYDAAITAVGAARGMPCRTDADINRLLAELANAEWDDEAGTIATAVRTREMRLDFANLHKLLDYYSDADNKYMSLMSAFSVAQRFRDAPERDGPEDYEVEIFHPRMSRIIDDLIALA